MQNGVSLRLAKSFRHGESGAGCRRAPRGWPQVLTPVAPLPIDRRSRHSLSGQTTWASPHPRGAGRGLWGGAVAGAFSRTPSQCRCLRPRGGHVVGVSLTLKTATASGSCLRFETGLVANCGTWPLPLAGHITWPDLPCCQSSLSLVAGLITWPDLPCCRSLHQARYLSCCRPHHLARSLLLPVTSPGQTSLVLSLSLVAGHFTWPDLSLVAVHITWPDLSCCRSHHLARPLLFRSHHLARPLPLVAGHITWPDLSCCRSHHLARRLLLPVAVEGGVQLPGTWDCVRSRSWPTVACRLVGSSWRSTLLVVW